MQPTPVLLPGKSHGRRSLEGCSPWDRWGSDTTERLHFHFSLSCIGEGIDNPLRCSCLENPKDGGAWWAAVYGVAQSRTWLKRLSSSSSSKVPFSTKILRFYDSTILSLFQCCLTINIGDSDSVELPSCSVWAKVMHCSVKGVKGHSNVQSTVRELRPSEKAMTLF